MQLKITRLTADPQLPLLGEIPSFGVCRIEGFNGIGKSLTVRLLRLCAGEHPYVGQQDLWDGFRQGIGRVRVEAAGLADGESITWQLDAQSLPSDVTTRTDSPTESWFEVLEIDGKTATLAEIMGKFEVRPIRANEGLLETLADEAEAASHEVRVYERLLDEAGALATLEQAVSALLRLLEQADPGRLRDRRHQAKEAREKYILSLSRRRAEESMLKRFVQGTELSVRLQRLSNDRPTLEAELDSIATRLPVVRAERLKAQNELEKLESELAESKQAQVALTNARRSFQSASTRVANAMNRLTQSLQIAGLSAAEDAEEVAKTLNESLEVLRAQRLEMDASPVVLKHGTAIRTELQAADAEGVGAQAVAELSGRNYTFRQLDEGISLRTKHLKERPTASLATELDAETAKLSDRLTAVQAIPGLADAVADAKRRKDTAEENLSALTATAGGTDLERLETLRGQRRAIDDELYALGSRRIVLTHQLEELGSPAEQEQVAATLSALLTELGLEETDLPRATSDADERLRGLAAENDRDQVLTKEADAAASRAEEDLNQVAQLMSSAPELKWLTSTQPTIVPTADLTVDQKADRIERLIGLIRTADDRIDRFRQSLTSARVALEAEATVLRGGESNAREFRSAARSWAQDRAEEWFQEEAVRKILLGEVGPVSVDLDRRAVSWADRSGVEHAIPLQGFSSGQSVFAYTEAQLLRLGRAGSKATNRLIVIDEFGAFVARNRLEDLRRTLLSWQSAHEHDQIVLILPVNQDYEQLLETAVGNRASELERILEALQRHGYFAESFEA